MFIIVMDGKTIVSNSAPKVVDLDEETYEVSGRALYSAASYLYRSGLKIEAIKIMRPVFGGLKETKDFVEQEFSDNAPPPF